MGEQCTWQTGEGSMVQVCIPARMADLDLLNALLLTSELMLSCLYCI